MGLPLLWCILNVVHLWWSATAKQIAQAAKPSSGCSATCDMPSPNVTRDPRGLFGPQPFWICGDDLLTACNPQVVQAYESLVAPCGAWFSKGKHLVSEHYEIFHVQ